MLILKRKPGQSIMIGRDIEVRILDIGRGQTSVGIDAPKSLRISRKDNDGEDSEAGAREKDCWRSKGFTFGDTH